VLGVLAVTTDEAGGEVDLVFNCFPFQATCCKLHVTPYSTFGNLHDGCVHARGQNKMKERGTNVEQLALSCGFEGVCALISGCWCCRCAS
jgi:hypothetical protein